MSSEDEYSRPEPVVYHKKHKPYSGPVIEGCDGQMFLSKEVSAGAPFIHRALYLLAMVECEGKFGKIDMSRGTGVSAGLYQVPASYPKQGVQGPLFELLREFELVNMNKPRTSLEVLLGRFYKDFGWFVAKDGYLRYVKSGYPVEGVEIRIALTPLNGIVPGIGEYWDRTKEWALMFHDVFIDPEFVAVQLHGGMSFVSGITEFTKRGVLALDPFSCEAADLAHCVAIVLSAMRSEPLDGYYFDSVKVTRKYDSLEFAECYMGYFCKDSKYQLIREYAMKMKCWDKSLFEGFRAIMPKDPAK